MMSGLNDRLWGDSGVSSVHGTLGATMEPPAPQQAPGGGKRSTQGSMLCQM
jgi:hypothetical protein